MIGVALRRGQKLVSMVYPIVFQVPLTELYYLKSYVSLDLSQSLILLFILKVYVKRLCFFGYRKVLRKENKYFKKIIIFL